MGRILEAASIRQLMAVVIDLADRDEAGKSGSNFNGNVAFQRALCRHFSVLVVAVVALGALIENGRIKGMIR